MGSSSEVFHYTSLAWYYLLHIKNMHVPLWTFSSQISLKTLFDHHSIFPTNSIIIMKQHAWSFFFFFCKMCFVLFKLHFLINLKGNFSWPLYYTTKPSHCTLSLRLWWYPTQYHHVLLAAYWLCKSRYLWCILLYQMIQPIPGHRGQAEDNTKKKKEKKARKVIFICIA